MLTCEICGHEGDDVEAVTVSIHYAYGPIMAIRCRGGECQAEPPSLPAMAVIREM